MAYDWFEWNGVKCTEYGIHVSEQPPITLPSERVTYTNVPGRSGNLSTLEGESVYDDMILPAQCFITDTSRINEIAAWLRGSGTVTFANRQGGFYHARIVNQIPFEKILRGNPHRTFAVNFRCQPFFYHANVQDITVTSGDIVKNPGSVYAEPVIQITLAGDAEITIGGSYFELTDITGTVTIDTPLMEVYKDYESHNTNMSGDFPILKPGDNIVAWDGGVTQMVVIPNWRSL